MIARLLVLLIVSAAALPAQQQNQTPSRKELLQSRVEGFYTAWTESRWKKVEAFLDEDAKVLWAESKKQALYSFELKFVEVLDGGKRGISKSILEYPTAGVLFPARSIKIPVEQEWVWVDDNWFVRWTLQPPPEPPKVINPEPEVDPNTVYDLTFDPEETFDYRLVRRGDPVKAKFSFTNTSGRVVKLQASSLDLCKCLTLKVSKTEVKPGEGGTIELTMDSSQLAGFVTQAIVVEMEPSRLKRVLNVEGTIFIPTRAR